MSLEVFSQAGQFHRKALWIICSRPKRGDFPTVSGEICHHMQINRLLRLYSFTSGYCGGALNFILGSHGIFALAGTWFLVSSSPWYQMILFVLKSNSVLYHCIRAFVDYNIAYFVCLFTFTTKEKHSCVKTVSNHAARAPLMAPPLTPSTSSSPSQKPKESCRCEVASILEVFETRESSGPLCY